MTRSRPNNTVFSATTRGAFLLRTALIVLALALLTHRSSAQAQNYPFEHLSLEEGLSQTSVQDIIQDGKGFLWIATQDGLNRYDGYGLTVFRHNPLDSSSIGGSPQNNLFEDRSGAIWVTLE